MHKCLSSKFSIAIIHTDFKLVIGLRSSLYDNSENILKMVG